MIVVKRERRCLRKDFEVGMLIWLLLEAGCR